MSTPKAGGSSHRKKRQSSKTRSDQQGASSTYSDKALEIKPYLNRFGLLDEVKEKDEERKFPSG